MKNKPLLSICIPTYNRDKLLKETLESIVSQPEFMCNDDVEVIISDNCSTDDTKEVANVFVLKYPGKIKYYCNDQSIGFDNMAKCLSLATGEFLKLNNDTLIHKDDALKVMLNAIKENIQKKAILFFSNQDQKCQIACSNIDEFIKEMSYYNTWIGSFGIWRDDFCYDDFIKQNYTLIPQTYVLLNILSVKKALEVYHYELFSSLVVVNKGGYNIAEVFGKNYLNILKEFVVSGDLSQNIYEQEKKIILKKHINNFYFDIKNKYNFNKTGYFKYLWEDYKSEPYFYWAYIKEHLCYLKKIFKYFEMLISIKTEKKADKKRKKIIFLGLSFYSKWCAAEKRRRK